MTYSGAELDEYVSLFESLAGASAAILALVLAAFQLNIDRWRSDPLRQPVALVTIAELATPLFTSLIFLMPTRPWDSLWARAPGVIGYLAVIWHIICSVRYKRTNRGKPTEWFDRIQIYAGAPISAFTFSVIVWSDLMEWRAAVAIWFIFLGITEAWFFLPKSRKIPTPVSPP